ncbi:hypothetical protein D3C73_954210 [compost metagenome]
MPTDQCFGADAEGHAALRSLHAFRANEGLQIRVLEQFGLLHGELQRTSGRDPGQVFLGGVVLADAHETGNGVELVGELVALGAQGCGHGPHGVELAGELLQFRAIPQHDHPAKILLPMPGFASAGHQNASARHDFHGLGVPGRRLRELFELFRDGRRCPVLAGGIRHVQEPCCGGVEHGDPSVCGNADHTIIHALEHRHLVVDQGADLFRFQAEGESLEPATEQEGGQDAGKQRAAGGECNGHNVAGKAVAEGLHGIANADLAHDCGGVLRSVHRHLRPRRWPQRSRVAGGDLLPAQRH